MKDFSLASLAGSLRGFDLALSCWFCEGDWIVTL